MKLHNTQQACLAQLDKDIAVWKKVEFICCTDGLFDTFDSKVAWAAKDMVHRVVAGLGLTIVPINKWGEPSLTPMVLVPDLQESDMAAPHGPLQNKDRIDVLIAQHCTAK